LVLPPFFYLPYLNSKWIRVHTLGLTLQHVSESLTVRCLVKVVMWIIIIRY